MRFLTVVFSLALSVQICFAQVMIAVPRTIHTPYGNATLTSYQMGMPFNYNLSNKKGKARPNSMTYEFRVVLKNDSSFSSKAKINVKDIKHHTIVIKGKKEEIAFSPSETKSVSRVTMEGVKIPGVPTDSCWLFKTYTGKINVYSFLAELGTAYAIAIQDGADGVIKPLTKENLLEMVEYDNPKVHELIEKGDLIDAIRLYNKK
jgi:hypothetical protein